MYILNLVGGSLQILAINLLVSLIKVYNLKKLIIIKKKAQQQKNIKINNSGITGNLMIISVNFRYVML